MIMIKIIDKIATPMPRPQRACGGILYDLVFNRITTTRVVASVHNHTFTLFVYTATLYNVTP